MPATGASSSTGTGASSSNTESMFRAARDQASNMLPELNCFGRKPLAPWGGVASSGTAITRATKNSPTVASGRRPTPPTTYLRGGARDATAMPSTRNYSTIAGTRSGVGTRSRGALSGSLGSSSMGSAARSLTTPPTRSSARRPVPAASGVPLPNSSCSSNCAVGGPAAASPLPAAPEASKSGGKAEKCDKCDGKHSTEACPWFKKPRDKHPDAKPASEKKMLGMQSGPVEVLKSSTVRVIRQPGDGSCLYHSLSYGLKDGSSAATLRRQIAEVPAASRTAARLVCPTRAAWRVLQFISANPTLIIADSPLKDWVLWDSGSNVAAYCRKMSQGSVWGGGIEMAAVSHMKRVDVFVYQQSGCALAS